MPTDRTNAERQARHREKLRAAREQAQAGRSDAALAQAVRLLHARIEFEASQGDDRARALLGETPAETLLRVVAALGL